MAAFAHGRAVIGCNGANTDASLTAARDALALTPAGNAWPFAGAAVELTSDPGRLTALGAAGRRLYEARFDWAVIAGKIAAELEKVTARSVDPSSRPHSMVFVAHEVGGPGGMERQSGRLVSALVEAGRPVTVVARSCSIREREGLQFVRVRTPRRPASLGYPAFFDVASLLVAGMTMAFSTRPARSWRTVPIFRPCTTAIAPPSHTWTARGRADRGPSTG